LQFQSATELAPLDARGWLGLARVRNGAGQPAETAAALDEVLHLDPDRAEARALRAQVRLQLGQDQGALLDAREASRLWAGDSQVWLALVRATARVKGAAAGVAVAEKIPAGAASSPALVEEVTALRAGRVSHPGPVGRVRDVGRDHAERWPGALGTMMRELVG